MSAIAGCQAWRAAVPAPEVLARLARAIAPRGPDGTCQAIAAGVAPGVGPWTGMAHAALGVAPCSDPEPLLRRGVLLLTWDGRLDNRGDLRATLGTPGPTLDVPGSGRGSSRRVSDLELLAAAYERWGTGFPARVVGDFALALWDGRQRRLLLARDPGGTRPLFYAPFGAGLVWASTLRALGAAGVALGEIEEEWIAGYFARSIDPALTPWANVRAVPPGCTLVAAEGEIRIDGWWSLDAVPSLHLGGVHRDAEYEERFREVFLTAVRRRLRAAGPVTAELSGGLDSSAIVCAADHLLRLGAAEAPDLFTVSHVYERSASADERLFIREVEARTGRRRRHVLEGEAPRLAGLTADALDVPSPSACFRELHRRVFELMSENGSRVLLSGLGGDHLLVSEVPVPFPLADLLQAGELRAFLPALRHWRAELDKPYLQVLWEGALCPLLPRPVRLRLAPLPLTVPPWIDRGFARRWDLAARSVAAIDLAGDFPGPGKRLQAGAVQSVLRAVFWMYDRWDHPVEVAFPFLDRDLVEFCLGVPGDQLVRPGETRSLLRRALAGLLPPAIARRRDKRGPDEAVLRAFAERWSEIRTLADEPRAAARGWLDPAAFRRALEAARFGKAGDHLPSLLPTLALEAWLRTAVD